MRDLSQVVKKKAAAKTEEKPVQQPEAQKAPDALAALAAGTVVPAQQGGAAMKSTPVHGSPAATSPAGDRKVLPSVMAKVKLEGVKSLEALTLERGDKCVVPFRIVPFGLDASFTAALSNGTIGGAVTGFELQMEAKSPRLVIKLRVDSVPASGGLLIPDDRRVQMGFAGQNPIQVYWIGDGPTAHVGYDLHFLYLGQKGTVQTEGDPLDSIVHSFALRILNGIPELLVTLTEPNKRPFCAQCGYDFRPRDEKSCPSCKTVRGESEPRQQPAVAQSIAPTAQPAVAQAASAAVQPTAMGVVAGFQPIKPPASATPASAVVGWSGGGQQGSAASSQPTPPVVTPPGPAAPQAPAPAAPDPVPAAVQQPAATSTVPVAPAAHAGYVPQGMPTASASPPRFCGECGTQAAPNTRFCGECSHPFP